MGRTYEDNNSGVYGLIIFTLMDTVFINKVKGRILKKHLFKVVSVRQMEKRFKIRIYHLLQRLIKNDRILSLKGLEYGA